MDKLNTELYGGFPFELNDWRWEIEAHRKAFGALGDGLGNGAPIAITGLIGLPVIGLFSPGYGAITAGVLAWGAELWEFAGGGGNPAVSKERHYLHRVSSLDPSGVKTFEDGSTQNPYERRRLELVADGTNHDGDPDYVQIASMRRLYSALNPTDWTQVIAAAGFELPAGAEAAWRIEPGGILRFRGQIRWTGSNGGYEDQAFTLPSTARPLSPTTGVPVFRQPLGGVASIDRLGATRNDPGWVGFQILNLDGSSPLAAGDIFYLDGISYPVAG